MYQWHILLIYWFLHKSLQYALNSNITWYYHWPFPVQLTHLMILLFWPIIKLCLVSAYPKILTPLKYFFPFSGKAYKVYEAVPSTNKESIGKGKPRKPLGLPFNHFCLHFITGSPRITLILRNRKYFVKWNRVN